LIAALTLVVILITEELYRDALFAKSLKVIPHLQKDASFFKIDAWHQFSNIGLLFAILAPTLVSLATVGDRVRTFYYVLCDTAFLTTMSVSKLFYHSPRPFWVSTEVKAFSCQNEFGNPSGHSMFSAGIALVLWFDF